MISALLDHLWQSTLFGVAAGLVALCLRGNSAAVRHGLWLAASLKFLVPFSALYLLGAAAGIPPPVESQPAFFPDVIDAAAPVLSPAMALHDAPRESFPGWMALCCVLWLLGSLALAWRWVIGWRRALEVTRGARPAPGEWRDTFVTDAAIEPSVARVLRPVVLLPARLLERLQPAQLSAVMAHEQEHIARHDVLKSQLHRLVETLFWFHPLVWMIGRRLEEERERACDEAVLADGHEPAEYAAGILAVCRHCAGAPHPHSISALAGNLPARVAGILDARTPAALGFLRSFSLSLAAFLLTVVPLFAGSIDAAARHHLRVQRDARLLMNAAIDVRTAANGGARAQVSASEFEVNVRNSSLRELLALAYDVEPAAVGGREWLDHPRYDISARLPVGPGVAKDFDPVALRGLVTQVLASRFNVEIHVNHLCEHPCGPRALAQQRN